MRHTHVRQYIQDVINELERFGIENAKALEIALDHADMIVERWHATALKREPSHFVGHLTPEGVARSILDSRARAHFSPGTLPPDWPAKKEYRP